MMIRMILSPAQLLLTFTNPTVWRRDHFNDVAACTTCTITHCAVLDGDTYYGNSQRSISYLPCTSVCLSTAADVDAAGSDKPRCACRQRCAGQFVYFIVGCWPRSGRCWRRRRPGEQRSAAGAQRAFGRRANGVVIQSHGAYQRAAAN